MSDYPKIYTEIDGSEIMYAADCTKFIDKLRAELAELRAQVPDGHLDCWANNLNSAGEAIAATLSWVNEYRAKRDARPVQPAAVPDDVAKDAMLIYEKALVKLATLGNEPLLGNSIGNVIAQDALAQAAAILAANKENKT